jgi:hypothetical protein
VDKKRPPVEQKEEEAVRLPRLSPQAAEGAIFNIPVYTNSVNPLSKFFLK